MKLRKPFKIDDNYILTLILATFNGLVVIFYTNPTENQVLIGVLISVTSILLAFRARRATILFLLLSILAYINLSIAVMDCIYGADMFPAYQRALRHSMYNEIYAKCILLTITIVSLILTPKAIEKAISININSFKRKSNSIISYVGIACIIYALIFGYVRIDAGSGYVSNAKPLYEYAILVFLMVWYYAKDKGLINYFLLPLFATVYIIQGLYYGDRSSALVLMVLIAMLYMTKLSVSRMLAFGLAGVILSNTIGILRSNDLGFGGLVRQFNDLGHLVLFSDTASYSYYAGITIVASRLSLPENPIYYLQKFILGIFLGSSTSLTNEANITVVVRQVYFNGGGGLYPSYFYFWGEYWGLIIGAIILGLVLYKAFTTNSAYFILMQLYLTTMCFRWYLYTPMTFFRTSIAVFTLIYGLCLLADRLTPKRKYFKGRICGSIHLKRKRLMTS